MALINNLPVLYIKLNPVLSFIVRFLRHPFHQIPFGFLSCRFEVSHGAAAVDPALFSPAATASGCAPRAHHATNLREPDGTTRAHPDANTYSSPSPHNTTKKWKRAATTNGQEHTLIPHVTKKH